MELVARGDGVLRKRLDRRGRHRARSAQLVGVIARAGREHRRARRRRRRRRRPRRAAQPAQVVATTQAAGSAPAIPRTPGAVAGRGTAPPQQKVAAAPPASAERSSRPQPPPPAAAAAGNGGGVRSSPLARRLASRARPRSRQRRRAPARAAASSSATSKRRGRRRRRGAAPPLPRASVRAVPREGDFQDVPLTQIRKTIARAARRVDRPDPDLLPHRRVRPHARRRRCATRWPTLGDEFKVSVNDILLKAVAIALAQHPEVNAHWLGDQHPLLQSRAPRHGRRDGRWAHRAGHLRRRPEAHERDRARGEELAKRARERKLKPEEYTGSTFSVSQPRHVRHRSVHGDHQSARGRHPRRSARRGQARSSSTASSSCASACASR